MSIEVEVYERDAVTLVDTLETDNGREFLKELSAPGTFSLEIKLDTPDEAVLTEDRVVRFKIDGTARWQGLVDEIRPVKAAGASRHTGRVSKASGRGLLWILDDGVIYPELGLGRVSPETRYFNFASWDYDDSGWGAATALKQQGDPDPSKPWYNAPAGWPDTSAWWIGPVDGDVSPVDPGYVYCRGVLEVPVGEGGEYRTFITADDGFELYVDGYKVASEQLAGLWGTARYVDLLLDEGEHLFAFKAINFDRPNPATNVFGIIVTVARLAQGGAAIGSILGGSGAGTLMLAYPATAPGMTAGKILDVNLLENQFYGNLDGLTWDFDGELDSNGDPWEEELDIAVPVSSSLFDLVRMLVDARACDVEMDAEGLVLHAYVAKGTDLSATVTAEYAENLSRLGFRKQRARKNVALSKTAEGRWIETEEPTSVAAHGRRVVGLSLGSAPSDDAALRQTSAYFEDNAFPISAITDAQIEAVTAVPFEDFDVGDSIGVTDIDDTVVPFQVQAIRVAEDEASNAIYTPELVKV